MAHSIEQAWDSIFLPFSVYQSHSCSSGEKILPVTESARLHRGKERKRGRLLDHLFGSEGGIGPGFGVVFRRNGAMPTAAAIERRFDCSLEAGDSLGVYQSLADRFSLAVARTQYYQPLDPEVPIVFEPREGVRLEMGTMAILINTFQYTSGPVSKRMAIRYCDYSAFPAQEISSSKAEWLLVKEILMHSLASLQRQRIRKKEAGLVVSVTRRLLFDTISLERKILAVDGRILTLIQRLDGSDSRRELFETYLELAKLQGGELFFLD